MTIQAYSNYLSLSVVHFIGCYSGIKIRVLWVVYTIVMQNFGVFVSNMLFFGMCVIKRHIKKVKVHKSRLSIHEITSSPLTCLLRPALCDTFSCDSAIKFPIMSFDKRNRISTWIILNFGVQNIGIGEDNRSPVRNKES